LAVVDAVHGHLDRVLLLLLLLASMLSVDKAACLLSIRDMANGIVIGPSKVGCVGERAWR
jgi:hypothetical protein